MIIMKINKILVIGLILIAASTMISTVCAADGFSSSSTTELKTLVNNDLTINGVKFKIPNGFEEVENDTDTSNDTDMDDISADKKEDMDGTQVDKKITSEFKNSAGDELEVSLGILANDKKIESINPANAEQKTIAGKEGYLIKDNKIGKEYLKFEYLEGGKLVKIEAPNEDIISSVIV